MDTKIREVSAKCKCLPGWVPEVKSNEDECCVCKKKLTKMAGKFAPFLLWIRCRFKDVRCHTLIVYVCVNESKNAADMECGQKLFAYHEALLGSALGAPTLGSSIDTAVQEGARDLLEQNPLSSRACSGCGRREIEGKEKWKSCSACYQVSYCSKACQKSDWSTHKLTCKLQQRVRSVSKSTDKTSDSAERLEKEETEDKSIEPCCSCMDAQEAYSWKIAQTGSQQCARLGCPFSIVGSCALEVRLIQCPVGHPPHIYSEVCCSAKCRSKMGKLIVMS